MGTSGMTPSRRIQFSDSYEREKAQRLEQYVSELVQSQRRLERMLIGGERGKILAKRTSKDFDGVWQDDGGSNAVDPACCEGPLILFAADEDAPNGRVLTAGDNITLSMDEDGLITISSAGGVGDGSDDAVRAASIITADDESAVITGSRQLLAGTNISIDLTTPGEATISASGSSGGNSYFPSGWV